MYGIAMDAMSMGYHGISMEYHGISLSELYGASWIIIDTIRVIIHTTVDYLRWSWILSWIIADYHWHYCGLSWIIIDTIMDYRGWSLILTWIIHGEVKKTPRTACPKWGAKSQSGFRQASRICGLAQQVYLEFWNDQWNIYGLSIEYRRISMDYLSNTMD